MNCVVGKENKYILFYSILKKVFTNTLKTTAQFSRSASAASSERRDFMFEGVAIQPGFVRSMTEAPWDSNTGLRRSRLLAPASTIVRFLLGSFVPSLLSAGSLSRMASGFMAMEKPLQSEATRERSSLWEVLRSNPKIMAGLVLLVEKRTV